MCQNGVMACSHIILKTAFTPQVVLPEIISFWEIK